MDTKGLRSQTWWVLLIEGIAALVIGGLLLVSPERTLVVLITFVGLFFIVAGLVEVISIFIDHKKWGLKLAIGILGIAVGLLLLRHPLWSTAFTTGFLILVMGFFALIRGIIMLVRAFTGEGWGSAVSGVIVILVGIFLLANTLLGIQLTTTLIGIVLVVGGIATIVMSFRVDDTPKSTPTL